TAMERNAFLSQARADRAQAAAPGLSGAARQELLRAAQGFTKSAENLPNTTGEQKKPITIGVGEPFTITLTVAAYFALLFALPVLIYEAYAFAIPALNSRERRVAFPAMVAAPALFIAGVLFTYFVVLFLASIVLLRIADRRAAARAAAEETQPFGGGLDPTS